MIAGILATTDSEKIAPEAYTNYYPEIIHKMRTRIYINITYHRTDRSQ